MDIIFKLHADICKTLANPKRLEIINALRNKELNASELLKKINISKANLSQHLSVLIQKGVVIPRRAGKNIYYSLADERIIKACDLIREVLIKHLEKNNQILQELKK